MPKISPRRSSRLASCRRGGAVSPRTESSDLAVRDVAPRRKESLRRAADHHRDEPIVRRAGDAAGANAASVAQHGVAIGDLPHFLEEVADVDDGDAARGEPADEREQPIDVGALKAARRLVHQEHARIAGERAADLDDLPRGEREIAQSLVRVNLRMRHLVEQRARARARRLTVDPAVSRDLVAEQHVVGDRQMRAERQLLMDQGDAAPSRIVRRGGRVARAIERHLAAVGLHLARRARSSACSSPPRSHRGARAPHPGALRDRLRRARGSHHSASRSRGPAAPASLADEILVDRWMGELLHLRRVHRSPG